jgi:transcriptional regulator with XRE-family HTH domain
MRTTIDKVNFGEYLHQLRMERQLPLRTVADKLGIDISLLSKIEHGERFVQSHMLKSISELFHLNYRDLQIQFICVEVTKSFGSHPFFEDALLELSRNVKSKITS